MQRPDERLPKDSSKQSIIADSILDEFMSDYFHEAFVVGGTHLEAPEASPLLGRQTGNGGGIKVPQHVADVLTRRTHNASRALLKQVTYRRFI